MCEKRIAAAQGITSGAYIFMAHKTKLHSHIIPSPYCICIILTSVDRISASFKHNLKDRCRTSSWCGLSLYLRRPVRIYIQICSYYKR